MRVGRVQIGSNVKASRINFVLLDVHNSSVSVSKRQTGTTAVYMQCYSCQVNLFTSLAKSTLASNVVTVLKNMTRI